MEDLKNIEFLLPKTQKALAALLKNMDLSSYVLVGESALALHLCHRRSEDLDFFTYKAGAYDVNEVRKTIASIGGEFVNISDEQTDALIDGVKVTFFDAKWDFLQPKEVKKFNIASLEQLAIMKTHTLFLRAKLRDYYDLYFLVQKFGIKKIYELSKGVLQGINFKLFAAALLYTADIEDENIDYLMPTKDLSLEEIEEFFEKELKKICEIS